MRTVALLIGARPNYMKIFPIWREMRESHPDLATRVIHTGQHYGDAMADVFQRDLGMPPPDVQLGVGSASQGVQTGRVMIALDEAFAAGERPDLLVVVGDVNSTLAGALVGVKLHIRVAHVEAGLRSGDRSMPEEINRIATDAVSDLLLTSCRSAEQNLRREGVPSERIRFVGNVMIDSLVALLPRARRSAIRHDLGLDGSPYALVTLHRPANVDSAAALDLLCREVESVARTMPVLFPVHPRTRKTLDAAGISFSAAQVRLLPPLGYIDFLGLESQSAVVITDSGGVQEETTYLGVPCVTLRPTTERPITCLEGTNRLYPPGGAGLARAVAEAMAARPRQPPILEGWDGRAARRVVQELLRELARPPA